MLAWLVLLIGALGVAAFMLLRLRQTQLIPATSQNLAEHSVLPADLPSTATLVTFLTPSIVEAQADYYKLAFGAKRLDYRILDPHDQIVGQVTQALPNVMAEQRHFPRRPALLPKLLHAINARDSTREEISQLILQDAVLAGHVLRRANSSYYRRDAVVVEGMGRAINILGMEGLRAPVAAAVMQPVFKTPKGCFEKFAPMTWQLAHYSALAAQHYARLHQCGDPFIAHLAALLNGLGRIVLFRLTFDAYRERGNLMPRAEVFVQSISAHERALSREIAKSWGMSNNFIAALDAQLHQQLPTEMQPLARALYYGELAGLMRLLVQHGARNQQDWRTVINAQGLDIESINSLWLAFEQEET